MGGTQLIARTPLFRQIGNDAAENVLAPQVITGQSAKRNMSGDDAAAIGFDAELGLRSGADPIEYVGPVRCRYESLPGAAAHTLRHGLNELSEAPIAVQDLALACQ